MAYESVNVSSLRSSLNKIKEISQNKKGLASVRSSIKSGSWSGNTRTRIKDAIEKTDSYYVEINKYIEKCLKAADYIEEYKELDKEEGSYQSKVNSTKNKINSSKEDDDTSSLKSDLNKYNDQMSRIGSRKSSLKEKINNLINNN